MSDISHLTRENKPIDQISRAVYEEEHKRGHMRKAVKRHLRYANIVVEMIQKNGSFSDMHKEYLKP